MTTEILDAQTTQVAAYQPFYGELAKLEQDNAALVFQYDTPKGNKEARSHVFSLRKTKGALEKVRKEAKAESLRIGRAIDSEAAEIEARIEAMITVHQLEIDRIEEAEKGRVAALDARLNEIELLKLHGGTSLEYRAEIGRVQAIEIGADWQEYMARATTAKAAMLEQLAKHLADAEQREAEAAELARLRAEAEARAQAERDAAIAKAAAERAQAEAEAKAAAEAEKARKALEAAELEAKRKEQAAALAMQQERDRAQKEKEAAARREMELKLQAEEAERRRVADAQEAERQRIAAEKRAEEDKQRAVKAEQERIAAETKRIADEAAKREANKTHRAKINREALQDLISSGVSEDAAKACITLIAQGKVAHVSIAY
jgi:hypothetical protein